jgi:hypothetical protein
MDNSSTKKEFGKRVFVGIQSQALCFQFLAWKMGSGNVRSQAFCAGGSRFFRIKEAHSGNNKVWGKTGLIIQFHFDLKK